MSTRPTLALAVEDSSGPVVGLANEGRTWDGQVLVSLVPSSGPARSRRVVGWLRSAVGRLRHE